MLLNEIRKKIDVSEIISFDIFDTLLLRPYCQPKDLFFHIARIYNMPSFPFVRQDIEAEARRENAGKEDITFDEIYQNVDEAFKKFKKIEMDWEEMVLRPNPELKQVYDYALAQNKKIIITSDMYFSGEFLAKVLRKNGFDHWDKLYVSGDVGLCKASGNLFKKIMQDFSDISVKKILHIGDNRRSDYKMPQKLGISCILYKSVLKQFLTENKKAAFLFEYTKSDLGLSILLSFLANRWQNRRCLGKKDVNYWRELGYLYAGPLAYGYCRFVEKVADEQHLDFLAFIARDGYTLQKVFNELCPQIKTAYIYAPRFLNLICRLDYTCYNIAQTSAIIDYFSKNNETIKKLAADKKLKKVKAQHQFIQENKKLFIPMVQKNLENYKKYIKSKLPDNSKIGIVDTNTIEFSSQRLLQATMEHNLHGIYWSIMHQGFKEIYPHSSFVKTKEINEDSNVYTKHWNFLEFLLTSPEYPIKNISSEGLPIYDEHPHQTEQYRAKIYPDISAGALDFVKDVQLIFGTKDIFLNSEFLLKYINNFIEHPQPVDVKQMSNIKFGVDSGHANYIPLFADSFSFKEYLFHPKKTFKRIKFVLWKTPMQSIFSCLMRPIKIKNKGIKQIEISFFPFLAKQYFKAVLSISPKCNYKFIVGRKEI